jgi:hypothetical protein
MKWSKVKLKRKRKKHKMTKESKRMRKTLLRMRIRVMKTIAFCKILTPVILTVQLKEAALIVTYLPHLLRMDYRLFSKVYLCKACSPNSCNWAQRRQRAASWPKALRTLTRQLRSTSPWTGTMATQAKAVSIGLSPSLKKTSWVFTGLIITPKIVIMV